MIFIGSWLLIATGIAFQAQQSSGASLNIDVAIIIHDGVQKGQHELGMVKKAVGDEFPQLFDMGEEKTRVALVANHKETSGIKWTVAQKLTGKQSEMKTSVDSVSVIDAGLKDDLVTALKIVREQVLVVATKKPKVILLITQSDDMNSFKGIEEETKQLRDKQINIFAIFRPRGSKIDDDCLGFLTTLAGKRANVHSLTIPFTNADDDAYNKSKSMEWFKEALENELCFYEQKCFYADQSQATCSKAYYTPAVSMAVGDCNAVEKPPRASKWTSGSCVKDDCQKVCDELWIADCLTQCDKTVNRVGKGPWKTLDHCPRTYKCPKCSSTTTQPNATVKGQSETKQPGSSLGLILGITIPIVLLLIVGGIVTFLILRRKKIICKKKLVFKKIEWRKFIGGLCKKGKKGASKTVPKKGESAKKASPSAKFGKKGETAKKSVDVESGKDDKEKKATVVKAGKEATGKKAVSVGKKA